MKEYYKGRPTMAGYASSMLGLDPANPNDQTDPNDPLKKKKKKKSLDQQTSDMMSPFQGASASLLNGAGNQY